MLATVSASPVAFVTSSAPVALNSVSEPPPVLTKLFGQGTYEKPDKMPKSLLSTAGEMHVGMIFLRVLAGNIPEIFQLVLGQLESEKASFLFHIRELKAFSAPEGLAGIPQCWTKLIPAL